MKWLRPLLYIIDISHFTNVYEIFKTFTLYNWYITLYKICNVIKTLSVLNSEKYSKLLESVSFQHRVQLSRWIEKPVAKKQFNRHSFLLLLLFFVIFIITTIAGSRTCCKIIVWLSPQSATPSPSPAGFSWSRWWTNCANIFVMYKLCLYHLCEVVVVGGKYCCQTVTARWEQDWWLQKKAFKGLNLT